ncbi:WD repeat-containing protein 75 OS=Xenopus laevis GN=wdr75 PE=2 SV=1 [Rhizoctonia solani AG-1 IB]|uniref:WD repeat-containing protein 75 n=1 Tax=Thanatephorus cucumeris (strain AG1-IB / isolate 7/3/14) TaxID=1108050 RepID=A0A0B7F736_THACB|nr:WD repeat-containing protein 75 OS=Xenopus laevis GN=wdr75 PE=2 SV=1 [Rhizoctonia solani AG-1 IB]
MLSTSPKKSAEHKKKRDRDNVVNGTMDTATATTATTAATAATVVEGAPRKKRRKDTAAKRLDARDEPWKWTNLAESSVSALPPLFTSDSSYFFTSAASSLQIFSTATGRLISTIQAHSDTITALLLNPHDSTQLFSASLDGTLKRWDTHHGALLETLRIDQPVTHIATHSSLVDELFVVTTANFGKESDSSHVFRVTTRPKHQLPSPTSSLSDPPKAYKSSNTTHVGKTRRATGLAVSACGEYLIVIGGNKAYVSRIRGDAARGFTTFVSPDPLTCLAMHPTESYFATGDDRGVVRLWYCLNDTAVPGTSDPSPSKSTATTTTLHWHAHAVSAVSFTPSGAQLVSGGEEAVLVVWQLHSGQREYIPRVGAPIGAVSVCFGPNGGLEYAIALMDGGVVFVANDTLRITRAVRRVRLDPNPTHPLPIVSHSLSNRILLPATHPASLQILSRTGAGLSLVGELEVAPASRVSRRDETPIEPVRIGLVALSTKGKETDAQWLATVDSRADAEIYLKIWKWNNTDSTTTTTASNLCTLNTRIDRPHGESRVTSLAFHPRGGDVLATTGEDGLVKIWGIRKSSDEEFWICAASFGYRNHTPSKALFSPDGSLLAVIHGQCITLWDTENTTVPRGALSCVETKDPRELAFVGSSGRYLAVLGAQTVVVWDLVRLCVLWHVPLTPHPSSSQHPPHIAAHPTRPTFAIFQYPDAKSTRISIFGVSSPTETRTRTVPFKFDQPLWEESDEVQESSEEGAKARGISVDTAPFVPRTLFEDIFGRGAMGTAPSVVKTLLGKDEEVAEKKNPVETEKDKEKAKKADEFKAAKRARRKHRKVAKMEAKLLNGARAAKNNEQDEQGGQESDPETPESSEPATEADAVEDVVYLGMKRKPSFGDVSIKLVNGVGRVGVHSASDDEEDESGEEVV